MEFLEKEFYHNTVQQWVISIGIILGAVILAKIVLWISSNIFKKVTAKTKSKLDDLLIDMLEEPVMLGIIVLGFFVGMQRLEFTDGFYAFLQKVYHILITINFTWLIARTIDAFIREYLAPYVQKSEGDLDDQLLPIVRKGLRTAIWALGIIVALNNAGYDVGALIAGLGIGGIAFAMAAKDSVANIFGGFTVFTDKPFKIGDRIKLEGFDGTVTEIGVRSTRLKTLEGRIVTIPNLKFTDSIIENVSLEPNRKVVLNLGLIYDTTPEQLELGISLLKSINDNNPNTEADALISFNAFGDFSLGILFIYYITAGQDILQTQTAINLAILKQFNTNKLEFAFPTQTLYNINQG
jgi:MscS family membrane protein